MKNESTFSKLFALNVNAKTETKSKLTYLSWAWAWAEVKKMFPDATYTIWKDEENKPYMYDEGLGFMCYTTVTINGETLEMWLPVMDGANKAMLKESYTYTTRFGDKTCNAATMFDVNKTVMRCLVKNLAMFGLGLYIYAGEDLPEVEPYTVQDAIKEIKEASSVDMVTSLWSKGKAFQKDAKFIAAVKEQGEKLK